MLLWQGATAGVFAPGLLMALGAVALGALSLDPGAGAAESGSDGGGPGDDSGDPGASGDGGGDGGGE